MENKICFHVVILHCLDEMNENLYDLFEFPFYVIFKLFFNVNATWIKCQ